VFFYFIYHYPQHPVLHPFQFFMRSSPVLMLHHDFNRLLFIFSSFTRAVHSSFLNNILILNIVIYLCSFSVPRSYRCNRNIHKERPIRTAKSVTLRGRPWRYSEVQPGVLNDLCDTFGRDIPAERHILMDEPFPAWFHMTSDRANYVRRLRDAARIVGLSGLHREV